MTSRFKQILASALAGAKNIFGGGGRNEVPPPEPPPSKKAYVPPIKHAYRNKHRMKFTEAWRQWLAGRGLQPHALYNLAERYRCRYRHMLTSTVTGANMSQPNSHARRRAVERRMNPFGRPASV